MQPVKRAKPRRARSAPVPVIPSSYRLKSKPVAITKSENDRRVYVGSVIHGTLLPSDLLPAFTEELARVKPRDYASLRHEAHAVTRRLARFHSAGRSRHIPNDLAEQADNLIVDLMDALDGAAPIGLYFGAHEGDGSDFGWWPTEGNEP